MDVDFGIGGKVGVEEAPAAAAPSPLAKIAPSITAHTTSAP